MRKRRKTVDVDLMMHKIQQAMSQEQLIGLQFSPRFQKHNASIKTDVHAARDQ